MKLRLAKFWNHQSQFTHLAIIVSLAVWLVGFVGVTALVGVVDGQQRRVNDEALARAAGAVAAALSLRARSVEPAAVREVLVSYQFIPGMVSLRLLDRRDRVIAEFHHDGVAGNGEFLEPPAQARTTRVALGGAGWSPFAPAAQRLWFPARWQGFSGWLAVDQSLDHLAAVRARVWTLALLLCAAIHAVLTAALFWLARNQREVLSALEAGLKRGGASVQLSKDRMLAPRELWRFAAAVGEIWRKLRRNQREVEVAGRRNHELFQAHHDAAFIIDEHGQILVANRAAGTVFGFSSAEFEGMHADQLVADESMGGYREWWKEYWRTGIAPRQDRPLRIRALRRNRKSFEAELSLVQIRDGDGGEFAVTYRDISESVAKDARLGAAVRSAEDASRARNLFVATVSHELRTPMNGIIGMAELALAAKPSSSVREYLTTIRSCGRQMAAIVDDVLDISRMEAGRLDLDLRPFEAEALLDEIRAVYEPVARHKGLRFEVARTGQMPEAIIGDAVRIRQVLDNLLVNAFKFTDSGSVRVVCEVVDSEKRGDGHEPGARRPLDVVIMVSDTGIGIPADRHEAIFEPFTQGDSSTARRFGGAGLGLSLSRRLVQHMGGMMWVESREGKGSTFHVSIPCIPASPEEAQALREAERDGGAGAGQGTLAARFGALRVLVAEDNDVNRMLLEEILGRQGLRVSACGDGRQALAEWRRQPADLVITDLSMPGLDGYELAQGIRRSEVERRSGRRVVIVGFSASVGSEVQARCREAGMDACLTKPIEPAGLLGELGSLLGARADRDDGPRRRRAGDRDPRGSDTVGPSAWGLSSNGDPNLMKRIIGLALEELPDRLGKLKSACERNDTVWIQRHAHSLVNTLVALQQSEAAEKARRVEAGAGRPGTVTDGLVSELDAHVRSVLPVLRDQLARLGSGEAAPAP